MKKKTKKKVRSGLPAVREQKKQNNLIQETTTSRLIELAVSKDFDVGRLEKLIDLQDRQEKKDAKRVFDEHFAAFQTELYPISRNKKAMKDAEVMYAYSSIGQIQKVIQKAVTRHGFSYYWDKPRIDHEKHWVTVTFVLSGWGHEKRTEAEGPILQPSPRQNALQALEGTITYLRRYSMKDGLGLADDDDHDANSGDVRIENAVVVEPRAVPSKETKLVKEALNACLLRLQFSKLYSDLEILDRKRTAEEIIEEGETDKIKALKSAWDKELDERKKKGAKK